MEMLGSFIFGASGGVVLEVMRCLDEELRQSPAPDVKVRISVNVTAHFANNVTGGFTRLRGV